MVAFCEAHHAATAEEIIESCKIARGAIGNAMLGLPNFVSEKVNARKEEIKREVRYLINEICKLGDGSEKALMNPDVIVGAIAKGYLDAPQLKGKKCAAGRDVTRIINGCCLSVDPETLLPISEKEHLARIVANDISRG